MPIITPPVDLSSALMEKKAEINVKEVWKKRPFTSAAPFSLVKNDRISLFKVAI